MPPHQKRRKNDWGKKKVMITVKREILKLKIGAVMFNKMNQIKPYSSLYVGFDHHHYKIAEYLFEYGGNSKELDPSKLYFIYNLEGDKSKFSDNRFFFFFFKKKKKKKII